MSRTEVRRPGGRDRAARCFRKACLVEGGAAAEDEDEEDEDEEDEDEGMA